jgi:carbamoyl-phosphate synthase small subunit
MGGVLLLEDGRSFVGEAFGARTTTVGEVVFNTAMTGYQEVLTDPSYREQIVAMTVPHVGNYGVNDEDPESSGIQVAGFVVKRASRLHSNHRATIGLDAYLRRAGVPGLQGIDTRALVRHVREKGAMRAVISTDGTGPQELRALIDSWPGMAGRDLAMAAGGTAEEFTPDGAQRARVTLVDGGVKRNIVRLLTAAGCRVRVLPLSAGAAAWSENADLVFLSNGPGDPAALASAIAEIRSLLGKMPVVGICLGHQLIAHALGATTFKLPYGHRGANHPVRDERTGKVEITSQNHGFCVDRESLLATGASITHTHLNDQTVAGLQHAERRVMSVQFHPEACPGPRDSAHLIEDFLKFAGL